MKSLILLLATTFLIGGCALPRLGLKTIRYDEIQRPATSDSVAIQVFIGEQDDVPFKCKIIGKVQGSRIDDLMQQARSIGGIGLLLAPSGPNICVAGEFPQKIPKPPPFKMSAEVIAKD